MNGLEDKISKIEGRLEEISKRIDDTNKRIDDVKWSLDKRIGDLHRGMTIWFALLTLLIVVLQRKLDFLSEEKSCTFSLKSIML